MPITKSAKKALRQSERRRIFNLRRIAAMKSAVKQVKKTKSESQTGNIPKELSLAYKAIDKAAKKGVIKKNTAARKKSRLAKFLNRK